jgi:hypothetical protein
MFVLLLITMLSYTTIAMASTKPLSVQTNVAMAIEFTEMVKRYNNGGDN